MEKVLPKSWDLVKLEDYLDIKGGSQPPKSEFIYKPKEDYIRLLQIRDFGNKPVPTYVKVHDVTKFCKKDDILIARYGASLGRIVTGMEGAYNVALAKVITDQEEFYKRYLYYLLQTQIFQTPLTMISRSAQNGFAKHEISKIELPKPPLPTQHRIVEKIEELFSELDNGVENLKKAQKQLKTYRQAVLKDAFEGKLTKEWREQQKNLPTPEELLEQIKVERKAHHKHELSEWEKEVEHWEKGGRLVRKPQKPRRNYKPLPIDEQKIEIPEIWKQVRLCLLCSDVTDGDHQAPPKSNSGYPFITISNIDNNNKINFSDTFYVGEDYYGSLKKQRKPQKGDVLYTVTGSFGIPVLVDFDKQFCFQRHIGLLRSLKSVNQKWLYYLMKTPNVLQQAKKDATGTAQKTVSLTSLRQFVVPFMTVQEQNVIVNEIESRLSVVDQLEQTIKENLQRAEALRQSILKKAFDGELLKEEIKEEQLEITPFQQMQMIGVLVDILKEEYDMAYGEMALAKFLFLVDRLKKYRTGFNFKDWHWGPYDPEIRKRLTSRNGFFKKNTAAHSVIELKQNKEKLFKYELENRTSLESGVREIADIISKFKKRKKTSRQLELLATVVKVVENESTIELKAVRDGMSNWKTPKTDFKNKSEKFSEDETSKCLKFIKKQGWDCILF
ncbi:MAG: restriction endonuclease subunit S [Balneola sp.]